MFRIRVLISATCVFALALAGATLAASRHHAPARHPRVHGLSAPRLASPAQGARFQQLPSMSWNAVSGAAEYEYQLAADPRFRSPIVIGSMAGKGAVATHNLAAAVEKPVTDGTYYWRVRAVTASSRRGPWSATRSIVKTWTDSPRLLGPAENASVDWPAKPLVLSWTPVSGATESIVTIATDKALSHIVLGSATKPEKTWASVYALAGTLPAGQYYWAITPVDTLGHRGRTSAVASFSWSWPTATSTSLRPLNALAGESELNWTPEFAWTPVAGAARYEVQVSSAAGFPSGSIWCCSGSTIGTSATPVVPLNNNEYFWRVRAVDASGNSGQWNEGPRFTKSFDNASPTIPDLTMADVEGEPLPPVGNPTVETPIVKWSAVAGAGSYLVEVAPYEAEAYCDWSGARSYTTASLAWTPIAPLAPRSYCVQVTARSDVDAFHKQIVSAPTQLGGVGAPAFTYETRYARCKAAKAAEGKGEVAVAEAIYEKYEQLSKPECEEVISEEEKTKPLVPLTQSDDYLLPQAGSTSVRTPLFTWAPVFGASGYLVVIARDKAFTNVVDEQVTTVTAYAPPLGGEQPLTDETTSYYWAVVPINQKLAVASLPGQNSPQPFNKSSIPPCSGASCEPSGGQGVANQPNFRWNPVEGAVNYTIQIAENETFANPIEEVTTDATAYTSSATLPAYGTLYWRVRGNHANTRHPGLNWSPTQTFTRTLPRPTPLASNPTSAEAIPVLSWTQVGGATGYEVHVEQPDGTAKDFKTASTAFTASEWDGPGVWRWQARALFPTGGSATVPGGYFQAGPQAVAHTLGAPPNARGVKAGARIVISWTPEAYANAYQVAISTTETFKSSIGSRKISTTNWTPDIDLTKKANKGTLYWRVAAVDNKGNVGPFASGKFVAPKARCVAKWVKRKGKTVKVCAKGKHKAAKHK